MNSRALMVLIKIDLWWLQRNVDFTDSNNKTCNLGQNENGCYVRLLCAYIYIPKIVLSAHTYIHTICTFDRFICFVLLLLCIIIYLMRFSFTYELVPISRVNVIRTVPIIYNDAYYTSSIKVARRFYYKQTL
jgi:hypothetical protein